MSKEQDAIINSIMNHPKLSGIIHDAISAPLGSTKRKKAKAILSIVKKASGKFDGQGGPITIGGQANTGNSLNLSNSGLGLSKPSNLTPIPGLTLGGGTTQPTGLTSPSTKGTKVVVFPNAPSIKTSTTNKLDTNIDSVMKSLFGNSYTGSTTPKTTTPSTSGLSLSPVKAKPEDTSFLAGGSKPKTTAFDDFQAEVQEQIKLNKMKADNVPPVSVTKTTVQKPDGTVSTTTKQSPTTGGTQTNPGSSTRSTVTGSSTGSTTQNTGSTTGTPQAKYLSLEDAYNAAPTFIKQNLGPEYFAQTLIGMMGEGQIGQLEEALKKQYGLDTLLERKTQLEKMNPTVKQDMVDYVKARDEYIEDINSMLDETNNTMANVDISNPVTNAMFKNYRNYLYTLKGRQNQRYAEYVNRSIEQYNTDLTGVQNQYANALGLYNDAKKNIEDKYDDTKKVLIDMYKTLEDAPDKMLSRMKNQLEYNKLLQETADDAVGRKNWIPEVNAYKDRLVDKDGNLLSDVNLPGSLMQLSADQKYNPIGVFDTFTNGAKTSLAKLVGSSSADALKSAYEYTNQIDQAFSLLNSDAQRKLAPQITDMKNSLINNIAGKVDSNTGNGTGIAGYILSNYKDVNKAVKELSGKQKTWFLGGYKAPPSSKEQFIKDNPDVDPTILGAIFDSDQLTKAQLGSNYNIIDGLKSVAVPNNTSGGSSLVGLPEDQQLALYLTSRIVEPLKYQNIINSR